MSGYLRNVCLNVAIVTVVSLVPTFVVYKLIPDVGWAQFLAVGFTSVVASLFAILYVGCTSNERTFILGKLSALRRKVGL